MTFWGCSILHQLDLESLIILVISEIKCLQSYYITCSAHRTDTDIFMCECHNISSRLFWLRCSVFATKITERIKHSSSNICTQNVEMEDFFLPSFGSLMNQSQNHSGYQLSNWDDNFSCIQHQYTLLTSILNNHHYDSPIDYAMWNKIIGGCGWLKLFVGKTTKVLMFQMFKFVVFEVG